MRDQQTGAQSCLKPAGRARREGVRERRREAAAPLVLPWGAVQGFGGSWMGFSAGAGRRGVRGLSLNW